MNSLGKFRINLPKVLANKLKEETSGIEKKEWKYLNNLKLKVSAEEVFDMNQREEGVLKTDHRRILSTYTKETRNAFVFECHHYETNPDDSFECIDSWNSTLISNREIEISINFTDPLSLS